LGLIPESKIAEIRDRTDIVAIVGEHVPLRRAGANHLGLCPFHQEKSPSFNVSASKQFFYCFGCQKSGDVFRFLMELEGRTFVDVARDLARRAGVDIPEDAGEQTPQRRAQRLQAESERARLLKLCELATRFYESQLVGCERAQHYIESRGISKEVKERFRLGYAPAAWDALIRVMAQRGVPHELAESAGLVLRREGTAPPAKGAPATAHTHYDRFRDRVMFPLLVPVIGAAARTAGSLGDVIAFGGRLLPAPPEGGSEGGKSEGAKYINSPETPLYKKGENLYGLHAAREPIRQRRQVVLVEGNFDVLSLHQHGFENTVAPMGTALTEAQIQKLGRLLGPDGHVVLMLDGDKAGRSATMKDIALFMFSQANLSDVALLSQRDIDVRVARLPDGEDPDTYAQRDPEGLAHCVRSAKPALDYVLDEAIAQAEHDSVAGKAKVLGKVSPLLKSLRNQTVQEMYVDRLASSLGIGADLVWRHLRSVPPPASPAGAPASPPPRGPAPGAAARPGPGGSVPQGAPPGAPMARRHAGPSLGSRAAGPERGFALPARPAAAPAPAPAAPSRPRAGAAPRPADACVQSLLALCGDHPRLLPLLSEEVLHSIDSPVLSDLLREARDLSISVIGFGSGLGGDPGGDHGGAQAPGSAALTVEKLIELAPPEVRSLVATAALSGKFIHTENPEAELHRIGRDLRAHAIQREVIELQKALVRINKAGQDAGRHQLLERIQELTLLRSHLLSKRPLGQPPGRPQDSHTGQPGPGEVGDHAYAAEGDTPR
jgi:DNA primase